MSSTCIQNFLNIDQRKLWEIPTFIGGISFRTYMYYTRLNLDFPNVRSLSLRRDIIVL